MHKNTKWAKQILSMQDSEGKWGGFHSMAQPAGDRLSTEQALRRLERLGYTIEDECIQRAVAYMNDCLTCKKSIPDPIEKVQDWPLFTSLMLATWIRRFTKENSAANEVAKQWAEVITGAFKSGKYLEEDYLSAYKEIFGIKQGVRVIGFVFYPVSLVRDCLDQDTERAFVDYLLNSECGLYYVYEGKLSVLPEAFESKNASRYLGAIEEIARYKQARKQLGFVVDWLNARRNANGRWGMGKTVNDKVYFPLSEDWRNPEIREADCTERIVKLLAMLEE